MRCAYGYAPLPDEQSIDFPMLPHGNTIRKWYARYDQLLDFWKQHGNFLVGYEDDDPSLYRWIEDQRIRYKGVELFAVQ